MTVLLNHKMKGNFDRFTLEGMTVLKPNHGEVTKLHDEGLVPSGLGSCIWHASYLLIHYLSKLDLPSGQHIVEIGCGWGLPAAYIQKRFGARVLATDTDDQVKCYQQLISRINGVTVAFMQRSFCQLNMENLSDIDLFIGADICYSRTNAKSLAELFHHYMAEGKREIIIADSGRAPFFQLADEMRQIFSLSVHEVKIDLPTRTSGYILHIGKQ